MKRAVGLIVLVLLLAACGQSLPSQAAARPAPPAPTPAGGTAMAVTEPTVRPLEIGPPGPRSAYASQQSPPVRLRIPSIEVNSSLSRIGLNGDGTIEVPHDFNQPGWYEKGPAPGDQGPAVILGHLDSYTGPAVFARLSQLQNGSEVRIERADGSQLRFVVDRVATFPSDTFPTDEVYGATTQSALRLITCGGKFNVGRGRYSANVVAFATFTP
jgi:sortase family protein